MRVFYPILTALVLTAGSAGAAQASTTIAPTNVVNSSALCPLGGGLLDGVIPGADCRRDSRHNHHGDNARYHKRRGPVFVPVPVAVPVAASACGACTSRTTVIHRPMTVSGSANSALCIERMRRAFRRWSTGLFH